jgi:hypothetical protein
MQGFWCQRYHPLTFDVFCNMERSKEDYYGSYNVRGREYTAHRRDREIGKRVQTLQKSLD